MRQLIAALSAAALALAATPAFAQSFAPAPASRDAGNGARVDLSARAAGLDKMIEKDARTSTNGDAARAADEKKAPQSTKRSFWKTPWPYVIAGAIIVIAVVASNGGVGGGGGY